MAGYNPAEEAAKQAAKSASDKAAEYKQLGNLMNDPAKAKEQATDNFIKDDLDKIKKDLNLNNGVIEKKTEEKSNEDANKSKDLSAKTETKKNDTADDKQSEQSEQKSEEIKEDVTQAVETELDNGSEDSATEAAVEEVVDADPSNDENDKKRKKKQLKEEAAKQLKNDRSTYLRMKDALARGDITEKDYKHFLFDRIMTSIGKALGTVISRDPSWLFYKDQWAQRNANLLKQNLDKDRAKVVSNYTDEEKMAAMSLGDLTGLTPEQIAAVKNGDELAKTKAVEQLDTQLNALYTQRDAIQSQLRTLQSGEFDVREMAKTISDTLSAIKGIDTRTYNSGAAQSENESTGKTSGFDANIKGSGKIPGVASIDASAGYNSSKNQAQGSSKQSTNNSQSSIDALSKQWLNAIEKGYAKNSPQIRELTDQMIITYKERLNFIDARIDQLQQQIREINNISNKNSNEEANNEAANGNSTLLDDVVNK